jgi:hypothetical protein
MRLFDSLKKNASNGLAPNNRSGWGIPNMCAVQPSVVAAITGTALLSNQSNHSGISVKFIALSANGKNDSVTTSSNGAYSIQLKPGSYKTFFSKNGYLPHDHKDTIVVIFPNTIALSAVTLFPVIKEDSRFDFYVYNEPAGVLNIKLNHRPYEFIRVSVFDLLGRILLSSETSKTNYDISVSMEDVTDNIYFVKVETSEGTITKKIVKR